MVRRAGGGGSRGLVGRCKHAQRKYASCTRWTWGPARASLKVTGEACAERSRRKKPCSSSPHATRAPLDSVCCCFHCEKRFIFRFPWMQKHAAIKNLHHNVFNIYLIVPHHAFNLWLSLRLAASGCCSDNRSSKRSPLTPGFLPSLEPAGTRAMYPLPHPWALDHTKVGSGRRSRAHCDEATKSPLVLSTAIYARFARGNHKDNKA